MSFRTEAPQLPDEEPQTGESGLSDRNGTRRVETLSDLPPASELHYDNVEYDVGDEYYIVDQSDIFYVAMEDVCRGRRRTREEMADEEDNIEGTPPRKRERMEQEDDEYAVFELSDLERTSSPSSSLSPTLDFSPIVDVPSSRVHFRGRRRRREQMADEEDNIEEAPPRSRQHVEEEGDEYEVFEPINRRLTLSERFGWMRRSEQVTDEDSDEVDSDEVDSDEVDSDEEAFYIRSQDGEFEDDEFDVTNLELIPPWSCLPQSLESFPTVDAPFSSEHFWWMRRRQYVDSDEETPPMPHQNGVACVTYILIVFLSFSVIRLDPDGTVSISILSIPIIINY